MYGGTPTLVLPSGINRGTVVALTDVVAERERQITEKGWDAAHDDFEHRDGALAKAAAAYAYGSALPEIARSHHHAAMRSGIVLGFISTLRLLWPWALIEYKPKTPRRELVKAGALILAEIERLDREADREARR